MSAARRGAAQLAAVLLAAACAAAPSPTPGAAPYPVQLGEQVVCAADGVRVIGGFAAAGIFDCLVAPDGTVIVDVRHEPTVEEGINPSPWYALALDLSAAGERQVVLDYTDYTHRYAPWVRAGDGAWSALAPDRVELNEKKTRARLRLDLMAGRTWLAAQPLSPSTDNLGWTARRLAGAEFIEELYGRSREGRPLIGLSGGGEDARYAIVALTRQHPPETTGQHAFRGFVDRLTARSDAAAARFRRDHRIILAPMANPDGVDNGHWRLNAGGIDLNRDWGRFTQPETRALAEYIQAKSRGAQTVAFFDFHSTNRTVMYAPPLDAASPSISFLPSLRQRLDAGRSEPLEWSFSHNPEGGTAKGWALEALKAPGLTVELCDCASEAEAVAHGARIADAMIDHFTR
jgi:hypothetical protein